MAFMTAQLPAVMGAVGALMEPVTKDGGSGR